MKNKNYWFSIIETFIGVFIFMFWLLSIYFLVQWSINLDQLNKNKIIAAHLSRESIELIRNIRDSNFISINSWNLISPFDSTLWNFEVTQDARYFIIENKFDATSEFPISLTEIDANTFQEGSSEVNWAMLAYKLCINEQSQYTHECSTNPDSWFFRYLKIEKVDYDDEVTVTTIPNAYRVTAKVIWVRKWYHENHITTIITDWKKI